MPPVINNFDGNLNFHHVRGDDAILDLTFQNESSVAVDITGSTVKLTIKETRGGANVIQKTVTSHTAPASGQTQVVVDPADTSGLSITAQKKYYYDLELTQLDGTVSTPLSGFWIIYQDITTS